MDQQQCFQMLELKKQQLIIHKENNTKCKQHLNQNPEVVLI